MWLTSSCVLPCLACRTSPEWCQGWWGRRTCITFMGYTEVTIGRDRVLQELQPSMLPAEHGKGLGSPPGSGETPTTPAPNWHYICKSTASHQRASCWKGKWGAHSNHCCFGGTVSNANPHICPRQSIEKASCYCKPNHVHTGPSNSVVTIRISPLNPAWQHSTSCSIFWSCSAFQFLLSLCHTWHNQVTSCRVTTLKSCDPAPIPIGASNSPDQLPGKQKLRKSKDTTWGQYFISWNTIITEEDYFCDLSKLK